MPLPLPAPPSLPKNQTRQAAKQYASAVTVLFLSMHREISGCALSVNTSYLCGGKSVLFHLSFPSFFALSTFTFIMK